MSIPFLPRGGRSSIIATLLTLGLTSPAASQEGFTNLQFFPEDISRGELIGNMRQFSFALGVRCTYCHAGAEDVPFAERDWASDEKAAKRKAREMLALTRDVNERYLAVLPDRRRPNVAVRCATCHGGVSRPEAIDAVLEHLIAEEGLDFAEARYRELRERHYGSAAYDFREQPLVELAGRLARAENTAAAERMLRVNLEFNPRSGQSMLALAELYDRAGNVEGALEWYRNALELFPGQARIEQRIRELGGGR